jgi:prevent-host-death family protein
MKKVDIGTEPALAAMLKSAQKQRLLLTSNGKPAAVVFSLENYDAEDFALASSDEFWEMIQSRRRVKSGISLEELKVRLSNAPQEKRQKKSRPVKPRR